METEEMKTASFILAAQVERDRLFKPNEDMLRVFDMMLGIVAKERAKGRSDKDIKFAVLMLQKVYDDAVKVTQ